VTDVRLAEVFPPGEYIREEMEERGWIQNDLAAIMGRTQRHVSELVQGIRSVTPRTAQELAAAFDTSPEFWMNLETIYQLARARGDQEKVKRRARLYTYPVRQMLNRGWLQATGKVDELERQVAEFFGCSSLDETPLLRHAAKKMRYDELPPSQLAWLFRVKQLAETVSPIGRYDKGTLREAEARLLLLRQEPNNLRQVPGILSEAGVRFLVVEALSRSKIDGVCLWIDPNNPVIGITMRYDRVDNFWFVLRHEIEHVLRGDGRDFAIIDDELEGEKASLSSGVPERERLANAAAANFCVPQDELSDFIRRTRPLFSQRRIVEFAKKMRVHPGVVVGQLHARKAIPYANLRALLVRVRHIVTETALTDGSGINPGG
jgi:HTH-type transcriptional regulator/antitoxin HigA